MDRFEDSDDEGFISIDPQVYQDTVVTKVANAQREIVSWINSLSDFDLEGSTPGSAQPRSMSDVIKCIKEEHGVDVILDPVFDEQGNMKVTFEMFLSTELFAKESGVAA
jgi:hypothetical protein